MDRRHFLHSGAAAVLGAVAGCQPGADAAHIAGGFTGIDAARGHALRDALASRQPWPAPARTQHTGVLIAGGGVAGLAAARALRLHGVDDFALLELEDSAGGNSRGATVGGMACPLGAHYLPVPGDDAPEVQDLLEELGLRQRVAGRWQVDERHLCHSPQERLFFQGEWQEGLLPVQGVGAATLAQYQRFAALVAQWQAAGRWTIPVSNMAFSHVQQALAAITFIAYLERNGLDDAHLRWYLDYCCRDDYGAGIATVSAWAGIHYFASRHGFHAPGASGAEHGEREGLLTWPEGNAWLTRRLAAPLGARLHTGQVVQRIARTRQGVEVDALNTATGTLQRWQARQVVVALPVFVAARVVENAPDFLRQAAAQTVYAPWLVANIHIQHSLHDRPGAPPSWDNVLYDTRSTAGAGASTGTDTVAHGGLGYVDASHQALQALPGATVLTHYRALGDAVQAAAGGGAMDAAACALAGRRLLQATPWAAWRDQILANLSLAHPDLAAKTTRIDITRYGHAMAIPVPNITGQIGHLRTLDVRKQLSKTEHYPARPVPLCGPMAFAHSDWAGYSVFEEAFASGHAAGRVAARALGG
ncbi:MAG: FAD-dependent oxidoreductase [Rhodoferax sp.]|nr:FAD-dependent oxidoreductase [Rhodoferax sp.]